MGMRRAVVLGTTSIDLVAGSDAATTASTAAGNSGSNVAIRLAAAGWDVEFAALVGDDPAADRVEADLRSWNVGTTGFVRRRGYRTPRVFHVVDDHPHLLFVCPRCGLGRGHALDLPLPDELPSTFWSAVAEAELVVADIAQTAAIAAFEATGARVRWYEQSLREASAEDMVALATRSSVLKVSADDLDHYEPTLAVAGPRVRLVTRGSEGVELFARADPTSTWGAERHEPGRRVRVVDPIGAGDAFTAVAAASLADGIGSERWLADATAAAAAACQSAGARGDMIDTAAGPPAGTMTTIPFQCARCDERDA